MGEVRGSPATPVDLQVNALGTTIGGTTDPTSGYVLAVAANSGRKEGVYIQCTDTTTSPRYGMLIAVSALGPVTDDDSLVLASSFTSPNTFANLDWLFIPGQGAIWVKGITLSTRAFQASIAYVYQEI
jgi:hypothetical protein